MHRGTDCRGWPLIERKQALAELLADKPLVILCVQHVVGEGKWLFEHVLALELEGMVAMRLASVYKSGERPRDWLKIKGQAQCRRSGFRR
jgi:bifunctional non-homologous end joining protein LigD